MASDKNSSPEPFSDEESDRLLIDQINGGCDHAFAMLYYRYRDWVLRLAWRFTKDRQASEDILQETFLYFLGKFPGFVLRSKLKTFLYPVVRSLSISLIRKEGFIRRDSDPQTVLKSVPIESNEVFYLEDIEHALGQLKELQREILILRFVDDLALSEISIALDIPLGTVKSRLHKAAAVLKSNPGLLELFSKK